jgi:hypothetical protein
MPSAVAQITAVSRRREKRLYRGNALRIRSQGGTIEVVENARSIEVDFESTSREG